MPDQRSSREDSCRKRTVEEIVQDQDALAARFEAAKPRRHADPDYPRTPDFYHAIAASLLAGDVQARVVINSEHSFIEVRLIDGSRAYWSNAREIWGYTVISDSGDAQGDYETLPWDVEVEDAAKMIAMHDYPVPAEWPRVPPDPES